MRWGPSKSSQTTMDRLRMYKLVTVFIYAYLQ